MYSIAKFEQIAIIQRDAN